MDQNIPRNSRCGYAWCFQSGNPNVNIQQQNSFIPIFRLLQRAQQKKNTILQRAAVAGLWKLWRHPQFYRDKGSVFLCYQVHSCVNEEPQLIYHLICCMLFDCMLFPLEVFVVVVGLELNLNKLYGLWKFSCTDHQLTETAHYVQSQGR